MAKIWVKGYTKPDGTKVKGHYREVSGKSATPASKYSIDEKINSLRPGGEMKLGGNKKVWTTVERSGDGKELRFVRHTPKGFTVFKKQKF